MKTRALIKLLSIPLLTGLSLSALAQQTQVPAELEATTFSGPSINPSPACLCTSPEGHVYVGVDMLGSLGKGPNKGKIMRLIDTDNNGEADKHTVFAHIDNPRGLIAIDDKLYVLHSQMDAQGKLLDMRLSVLTDADRDGIADGEKGKQAVPLITDISSPTHVRARGADHCTNGIRMGIDGWIYIAIGDFGFHNATDRDGTKLTMLGGGILRVRPDGKEMEVYTHGLRNIYDVAIDPFMNIFTRGNTNDGGGWNVRFIHQIQSGEYGYPILFKGFTDEIIPALADVGGGSGVGSLFFQEPTWPEKYNNVPMMGDWGRSQLLIHRVTPDGPSFTQALEPFIKCSQISDLDVDGSGRLYIAAWDGAGYKGNDSKGYTSRVVPKGWTYKPFPELRKLSATDLAQLLNTDSATTRFHASQEILRRNSAADAELLLTLIKRSASSAESRVAALFTYAQLLGEQAQPTLLELTKDSLLQEHALRALADRTGNLASLPLDPFIAGLKSSNPRVQAVSATALGRIGPRARAASAQALLAVAKPPAPSEGANNNAYWTSKTLKHGEEIEIDVDISAYKELNLLVNADGSTDGNQVAWVNPRIVLTNGKEIDLAKAKGKGKKKLGKAKLNKDAQGNPLKDTKGKSRKGFGTTAGSTITLPITDKRETARFRATGVFTAKSNPSGQVKFILSPTQKIGAPEGPHATPNSPVIVPHLAVRALVNLEATDECLAAIDSPSQDGALWALRLMPTQKAVDGLTSKLDATTDPALRTKLYTALLRLHSKEAPYDGSWWWSTRPDTRGPYYKPIDWEATSGIKQTITQAHEKASDAEKAVIAALAKKHRAQIEGIYKEVIAKGASKKGEVGRTSIEDVVLYLEKNKGKAKNGKAAIAGLSCIACHNIEAGQPVKGPDLTKLGNVSAEDLAEAIIKPEAGIAKSWVNLTLKDGSLQTGTIVSKSAQEIVLHNIAGIPTKINPADVTKTEPGSPLMGPHLVDDLSLQQLADMIAYLKSLDTGKGK